MSRVDENTAAKLLTETVDEYITSHRLPPEFAMLIRQCVHAAAQTHDVQELGHAVMTGKMTMAELSAKLRPVVMQTMKTAGALATERSTSSRGSQHKRSALH